MPHGRLITNLKTVLYRTTAKCATQCTDKIFFAPIATSNTAYLFATRLVSPNTTKQCRGEIFFARIANHYHRIPCSQPDPSAPTPPTNVGAKYFSPESQTINTSHPGHNPTSQPQHHQSMEGRNIIRPNRNQQHRIPCSQHDPSAPTSPTNVGAKHFSPVSQPATPHTLYATGPVTSNIICQRAGEKYFAPTTYYRSALSR